METIHAEPQTNPLVKECTACELGLPLIEGMHYGYHYHRLRTVRKCLHKRNGMTWQHFEDEVKLARAAAIARSTI